MTKQVDAIVASVSVLTGAEFDEVVGRLNALHEAETYGSDRLDRGVLIARQAGGRYETSLGGSPTDQTGFATYSEALERARGVLDDALILNPEDVPVVFADFATGLITELPAMTDIGADFDRTPSAEYAGYFTGPARGAISVEAFCALCGEMCQPSGADDCTHGQRDDGTLCGGPLVPTGFMPSVPRPAVPARVSQILAGAQQPVRVLVSFTDAEACEAARIRQVQIIADGVEVQQDVTTQALFTVGADGIVNAVEPPVCGYCGDYLHTATDAHPELDGVLFDSAGDTECVCNPLGSAETLPVRRYGPHVIEAPEAAETLHAE